MSGTMSHPESNNGDVLRDKAVRIFKFLRDLALLKTKMVRDLAEYENVVWFHDVPEYKGCLSVLGPESDKLQYSTWLEIQQSPEPRRPTIPSSCEKWLGEDTSEDDPHAEPLLRDEINTDNSVSSVDPSSRTQKQTELLLDHPEILREWEHWKQDSWRPWVETHINWMAADKIYFQLFSIYQQLKKLGERYELLLGLGLLTWETPNNQVIRRHIIVGDANLSFDAYRAKFELQAAPEGVKLHLETDMIEQRYLPSLEQLKQIESLLSLTEESPWNKDEIDKILKSLINSISPHGIYSYSYCPPDKPTKEPTVTFAPAIILRTRTQRSQIQCINNIIEKIGQGDDIPSGVKILCEEPKSTDDGDEGAEASATQFTDDNVYLPLPTNEEQEQIVYQIRNQNGILVQGPPGTGKSHTIANIICHLLAEGKRVLVTSQTPRALKVLKEKIPEEVQALCVTLLGNDQPARQELKDSVERINQKYSEWDQLRSKRLITALEEYLYRIKNEKADKERLRREQREINTYKHEVAFGSFKGTAQQIAQRVASEESTFAWLKDDVSGEKACPLSNVEFGELLQLHRELPEDYCSELRKELVSREVLPDVPSFVKIIDDERKAQLELAKFESRRSSLRYRTIQQLPENDIASLHKSISDLLTARSGIRGRFVWIEQAVLDILAGNDTSWNNLHDFVLEHLRSVEKNITVAQTLDVQFTETIDRMKLRADSLDLLNHLDGGGGMGWKFLAPRVVRQNRYITNEVKVNGRFCKTPEQLRLLIAYLEAMGEIDLLWSAFQGKDNREDGSLLLQLGYLRERSEALNEVLRLKSLLGTAKKCLKATAGLSEPQWHKLEDVEEIVLDIQAAESEHSFKRVTSTLEQAIQNVSIVQSSPKSHDLNREILAALEERNAHVLARCLEKLESLEKGRAALCEREAQDERLKTVAPKLSHQLQDTFKDNVWNERITKFDSAWAWKIADSWVREFGKEHNEIALEASLKQLTTDEQQVISKLAAEKAWDNCLRKLTAFQRANLIAYEQAVNKTPRTLTAKRRPKWLREAQKAMDNCRGAIPAWIMPLYRVFETIPPVPECFDVVIVDEASQTGPDGLVLQYLAKQIIVVGDEKQISPDAIGVPQDEIEALIKRYLDGIPFKGWYIPQTSLFDFSAILFSGKIVLREHFRCMPEIIQFSNQLCYTGTPLKPLRQYPPNRLDPIVVHHVKNGRREGQSSHVLNQSEADELVEAIAKMCSSKEYIGKTMGVISLLGEAQAKYIENKLLTRLSPSDLEKRRIVCGDAYAFQGDERDVILLSMVDAPNESGRALTGEADTRRFNVAASRAKDQVVLFHTATLNDLRPACLRYKLLEYYQNTISAPNTVAGVDLNKLRQLAKGPRTQKPREIDASLPFGSWFEVDVCLRIADHGFKVIPQYNVAGYFIDMVVEGTRNQLAVECDGDEVHGIEQYERDMARQRILERCGWRFWRIRGHEYYRDTVGSLIPLWEMLKEMGIKPVVGAKANKEEPADIKQADYNQEFHEHQSQPVDGPASQENKTTMKPNSGQLTASSDKSTKAALVDRLPDFFYEIAQWGKRTGQLNQQEIQFIRTTGNYVYNNWHLSEERQLEANRIIEKSKNLGFQKPAQRLFD